MRSLINDELHNEEQFIFITSKVKYSIDISI